MNRDPIVAPLAALVAGVLCSRFVPFSNRELLAASALLFGLAVLARLKNTRRGAMAACLAALWCAGALVEVAHRPGPPPELDAEAREIVILGGCVVEPPVFFENRTQFVLELARDARARVSLYLKEGESPPTLRYGHRIEIEARVRRTHNFANPGSFDYAGYLARRNIYWTASAGSGSSLRVLGGDCGSPFWRAIFNLRGAALERLEQLYKGDAYQTAMMQAILIGESSRLERVWTEDFRRTGTFHALVISGIHVTVLAGLFLFLLRLCFCPEGVALALAMAGAWLYALVSGGQAPVARAAAGFTVFVLGRYFYRRGRLLNLLGAVAIGFLVFDPEQMFEASFQLSFLAVAAIAALAVPLIERTSGPLAGGLAGLADADRDLHLPPQVAHFRVELRLLAETAHLWLRIPQRWLLRALSLSLSGVFFVYELMLVSATVQVGLALPMAVYFHRLSPTGLSANVLIVPMMNAVVPVGFLAIFTGWTFPAVLASLLLNASRAVAEWHARWEPAWRIPSPPLWLALAFCAALIAFALLYRKRVRAAAAVAAVFVMALLAIIVWHPFAPLVEAGALELTAIDVGQAESLFLAFPDGKLMVLDGGGIPVFGRRSRPRLDLGEDVVSPYLWSRSIRRLDVVALSHAHEDHIGGVGALIDNFRPRELWTGAMPPSDPLWTALRARALRSGIRIVPLHRGMSFSYGGAMVQVLAPSASYETAETARNEDSLVLRVSYGRHAFLLTGDLPGRGEVELALERADVLKVAHHGSRTSTGPELLERTRPAFAVISAGFENSYNNPHPDLLARLAMRRTVALRTDLWGLITIRADGRRMRVDTERWHRKRPLLYEPF